MPFTPPPLETAEEFAPPALDSEEAFTPPPLNSERGFMAATKDALRRIPEGMATGTGRTLQGLAYGAELAVPSEITEAQFLQARLNEVNRQAFPKGVTPQTTLITLADVPADTQAQWQQDYARRYGTPRDRAKATTLYQFGADTVDNAREYYGVDRSRDEEFVAQLFTAGGELVPTLLAGALTGPAGVGVQYAAAAGEAQAQEAEQFGLPDQADIAFLSAAGLGGLSEAALGVPGRLLKIIQRARRAGVNPSVFGRVARGVAEGAAREGSQEAIEQAGGNLIASDVAGYDPQRPTGQGVPRAAALGATLGGVISGGGAAAIPPRYYEPGTEPIQRTPDETLPPGPVLEALPADNPFAPPPTVPESPATLAAQAALTADPTSAKAVTLVTPGERSPISDLRSSGLVAVETAQGTALVNPQKVDPAQAKAALDAGGGGQLLGMSTEQKPPGAAVLQTRTPDGTPVQDEVVTPATLPGALAASQAVAPAGTRQLVPAEQVIAARLSPPSPISDLRSPISDQPPASAAPTVAAISPAQTAEPAPEATPSPPSPPRPGRGQGEVSSPGLSDRARKALKARLAASRDRYDLIDAADEAGGIGGPKLTDALAQMRGGKTAAQVVAAFSQGGEYDALIPVLEEIREAQRSGGRKTFRQLSEAYTLAFGDTGRRGVDQALSGLESARREGRAPTGGVPSDTSALVTAAWDTALARLEGRPGQLTAQEQREARELQRLEEEQIEREQRERQERFEAQFREPATDTEGVPADNIPFSLTPEPLREGARPPGTGAARLDTLAQAVHGRAYAELETWQQDAIRQAVEAGTRTAPGEAQFQVSPPRTSSRERPARRSPAAPAQPAAASPAQPLRAPGPATTAGGQPAQLSGTLGATLAGYRQHAQQFNHGNGPALTALQRAERAALAAERASATFPRRPDGTHDFRRATSQQVDALFAAESAAADALGDYWRASDPVTRYSLAAAPGPQAGLSMAAGNAAAGRFLQEHPGAPAPVLVNQPGWTHNGHGVQGSVRGGRPVLNLAYVTSEAEALAVLREEYAHMLLATPEAQAHLLTLARRLDASALAKLREQYGDHPATLLNEWAAKVSRETPSKWQSFVQAVREWLAKLGVQLTPEQSVRALLRRLEAGARNAQKVRAAETQWVAHLTAWRNKTLDRRQSIALGGTPPPLLLAGAEDRPLVIGPAVLDKVAQDLHRVPVSELARLPAALADPVAVLQSRTQPEALVVLTELQEQGKPVLVAIHLNAREGRTEVNRIASLYGKPRPAVAQMFEDGLARYVNEGKSRAWFRSSGLQLPTEGSKRGNPTLATERDLVNHEPPTYSLTGDPVDAPGQAEHAGFRRAQESTMLSEDVKERILEQYYTVASNQGAEAAARQMVADLGVEAAIRLALQPPAGLPGQLRFALGGIAIPAELARLERTANSRQGQLAHAQQHADFDNAWFNIEMDYGRAISVLQNARQMTPESAVRTARRMLEDAGSRVLEAYQSLLAQARAAMAEEHAAARRQTLTTPAVAEAATAALDAAVAADPQVQAAHRQEQREQTLATPEAQQRLAALGTDPGRALTAILGHYAPGGAGATTLAQKLTAEGVPPEQAANFAAWLDRKLTELAQLQQMRLQGRIRQVRKPTPTDKLSDTQLDQLIRAKLREQQQKLATAAQSPQAGRALGEAIVKDSGLTGPAAEKLRAALDRRFTALATEAKRKRLDRLLRTKAADLPKRLRRPADWQRVIEVDNLGPDAGQFQQAIRQTLKLEGLTPEQADHIRQRAAAVQAIPEDQHTRRLAAASKLEAALARLRESPMELPVAVGINNLLTGPTTWFAVSAANFSTLLAETAVLLRHGPRAVNAGLYSALRTLPAAGVELARYWQTGQQPVVRAGTVASHARLENLKGHERWLLPATALRRLFLTFDLAFSLPAYQFREAVELARLKQSDPTLKGAALRRHVHQLIHGEPGQRARAFDQATAEGYRGLARTQRVNEIFRNQLPEPARQTAREWVEFITQNNRTYGWAGTIADALYSAQHKAERANQPGLALLARWTSLFAGVASNVLNQGVNWSPLGGVRSYWMDRGIKTGKGYQFMGRAATAEDVKDMRVRAVLGTLVWTAAFALALRDRDDEEPEFTIHGNGPRSAGGKEANRARGVLKNSVQIGDQFYAFETTPFAVPFSVLGALLDTMRYEKWDEKDAAQRFALALLDAREAFLNRSMLDGLATMLGARQDSPKTFWDHAVRSVSSPVVPNFARVADRYFDPQVYDGHGVAGTLMKNTPFLRREGRLVLNGLGEPVTIPVSSRFVSELKPDPVWRELARLDVAVNPARQTLKGYVLTADELYRVVELSGPKIRKEIVQTLELPKYREAGATPQGTAAQRGYIQEIVRRYHEQAKRDVLGPKVDSGEVVLKPEEFTPLFR